MTGLLSANKFRWETLGISIPWPSSWGGNCGECNQLRGSSVADYDGDGDLDMLVNMALFRNERGTFSEVASNISEQVAGTALSHAWGDVDGDGGIRLPAVEQQTAPAGK